MASQLRRAHPCPRNPALLAPQVDAAFNDGDFTAAALSGRLKAVTGAEAKLTMGGLTFGAVQPADLEVRRL